MSSPWLGSQKSLLLLSIKISKQNKQTEGIQELRLTTMEEKSSKEDLRVKTQKRVNHRKFILEKRKIHCKPFIQV